MLPTDIVLLDPSDEQAQKVGKAISSPLASEILHRFTEGTMTLTNISESLHIPINTAKYHIDNLLAANLLEIVDTKYSVKGREIKVYGLKNQVLIVAPKKMDIKTLLIQYTSVFAIAIFATIVLIILQPFIIVPAPNLPLVQAPSEILPLVGGVPSQAPSGTPLHPLSAVIAFILGAGVAILLAVIISYLRSEWTLIRR